MAGDDIETLIANGADVASTGVSHSASFVERPNDPDHPAMVAGHQRQRAPVRMRPTGPAPGGPRTPASGRSADEPCQEPASRAIGSGLAAAFGPPGHGQKPAGPGITDQGVNLVRRQVRPFVRAKAGPLTSPGRF
jgi:hypothetical protein